MDNKNFNSESTISNKCSNTEIIPLITYRSIVTNKSIIFKENKGKPGVYRWNNLITGKSYIGSSKDLSNRLRAYYSTNNIKRIVGKESSIICNAILKYNYENFSLDILEYCKINILIEREQYYLDLLKPEYNILKTAGSRLNHKLTEKTKKAVSIALRGKKRRDKIKKDKVEIFTTPKFNLSLKPRSIPVKVFDKSSNLLFEFLTINSAAKHFGVSNKTISRIFKTGTSYDDYTYKFYVKYTKISVYDSNKNLINIFNGINKVSKWFNIPPTTIDRYIKSGKLYENTFYFYRTKLNLIKSKCDTEIFGPSLDSNLSNETKQLISNTLKNRLKKLLPIKVTNIETNALKYFPSNKEAANYLGTSERTLGRYKSEGKILLKKYKITNNIFNNKSYK